MQNAELRGENISSFGSVCEVLEIFGAKRNFKGTHSNIFMRFDPWSSFGALMEKLHRRNGRC